MTFDSGRDSQNGRGYDHKSFMYSATDSSYGNSFLRFLAHFKNKSEMRCKLSNVCNAEISAHGLSRDFIISHEGSLELEDVQEEILIGVCTSIMSQLIK